MERYFSSSHVFTNKRSITGNFYRQSSVHPAAPAAVLAQGKGVYPAKNHNNYNNAETVSISHHGSTDIRPRGYQKFLRSFLQKATPRRAAGGINPAPNPTPELSYFNPVKPVGGEMRVPPRVMKEENEFITRIGGERIPGGQGNFHLPGIDLSRLTDQVYRMLERKITNERQRRGW